MWIDEQFLRLASEGYEVTSEPTDEYNCIAYAAGDTTAWWSHIPGYRWPNASRTPSINSLIELFQALGFELCDAVHEEAGSEKIASTRKTTTGLMRQYNCQVELGAASWARMKTFGILLPNTER